MKYLQLKDFFFYCRRFSPMFTWFICSSFLFCGCIQNEDEMYKEIAPGTYERSTVINSARINFVFTFFDDKNFTANIFAGESLISEDAGFWEQQENSLCIYSKNMAGCEEIQKVTENSFEIWDKDENKWVIFNRTS